MKYIDNLQYDTITILSDHMDVYKELDYEKLMVIIEQAEEQMHHLTDEELDEYNHLLEVYEKHQASYERMHQIIRGEIK